MRTYYLFFIKSPFVSLYKEKSNLLFKNFNGIYKVNYSNFNMGQKLYIDMLCSFNKKDINEYIYNKHKYEVAYWYDGNIHIINNIHTGEITKLTVSNTYLKIVSTKDYTCFLNTLYDCLGDLFVCDFDNFDYFWLDKNFIEMLV